MASCRAPARRARPIAAERMLLTEIKHVKSSEELFRNIISFNFPSPVAQRSAAFETRTVAQVGRAERHSLPRNSKAWLGGMGPVAVEPPPPAATPLT